VRDMKLQGLECFCANISEFVLRKEGSDTGELRS